MLLTTLLIARVLCLALYATLATSAPQSTKTTAPTEPTEPTAPTEPTEPTAPTAPNAPNASTAPTALTATSKFVSSTNEFAFALYKAIGEESPSGNLFLSPVSVAYGLAMLYSAAGGQTKSQLATAMRLTNNTEPKSLGKDFRDLISSINRNTSKYTLQLASSLFVNQNFKIKEAFLKIINETYGTSIEKLDFDEDPEVARKRINNWVATRTSGKMLELFTEDSITAETSLVLANAVFFKGLWLYAFGKNATKSDKFFVSARKTTNVSMMKQKHSKDLNYYNSAELGCQVLELPYAEGHASMFVFLPNDVEGLSNLENRLTLKTLATTLEALKEERVQVTMPKFAVDKSTSLARALGKLGVLDLFDSAKADLSGFDGSKRRAMTDIVHKAYVSVDEDGKVSAVMPAQGIVVSVEDIKFIINRPFLFLVMDKGTGTILCFGRVALPQMPQKQ